jgi:Tfp pilus assembly protein PilP
MKWRHQAAQNPQALKFQSHVLPDHPQAQMRMVGSVGSSHTSTPAASWAFIRSGNQIHAVQAGQYLGLEKVKVHSTDSKGLWLGGDEGQAPSLMAWELIKP